MIFPKLFPNFLNEMISNYISILPWYFSNYFPIYFPNDFQSYYLHFPWYSTNYFLWFPIISPFFHDISQITSQFISQMISNHIISIFPWYSPNYFLWFPIISPFFHDISQIISQIVPHINKAMVLQLSPTRNEACTALLYWVGARSGGSRRRSVRRRCWGCWPNRRLAPWRVKPP